jgi:hypothetical protein
MFLFVLFVLVWKASKGDNGKTKKKKTITVQTLSMFRKYIGKVNEYSIRKWRSFLITSAHLTMTTTSNFATSNLDLSTARE